MLGGSWGFLFSQSHIAVVTTSSSARVLRNADAALVCTEWDLFRRLDWERAGDLMVRKVLWSQV
jgi:UDP-glucose 6-dehydrogenase